MGFKKRQVYAHHNQCGRLGLSYNSLFSALNKTNYMTSAIIFYFSSWPLTTFFFLIRFLHDQCGGGPNRVSNATEQVIKFIDNTLYKYIIKW